MIEIKIDKGGKSYVKMSGRGLKGIISEAFMAIEAVYQAFDEHDHEDADAFKLAFYNAARDKKFFNWDEDDKPCKAKERTPEDELFDGFVENGVSEETAKNIVELAKALAESLHEAAEETCDEDDD